jgi:hypothetical protein
VYIARTQHCHLFKKPDFRKIKATCIDIFEKQDAGHVNV